ncbi:hypothetical protein Ddye_026720 [Dipteronia dyeriana]|uniref:Uncharacterized protein n=1 Tax=Dipteronia dyeriana TaxID=168575 RepID=A0AAD9WQT3_9ROSI|nr:hypothetical protein Ddye_026720 [Dipteronia dyeriana]
MKNRIELAISKGSISKEIRDEHDGFSEWNDQVTKQNHQSIVQIIIDGRGTNAAEKEGCDQLPTLVYMAREKRPGWPHNFKAGAMNSLIRVSSEIDNGSIILNLDCDMFANNADSIQEALCFFMHEKSGHEIAFVQHPQIFYNTTPNDLYSNNMHVIVQVHSSKFNLFIFVFFILRICFDFCKILMINKVEFAGTGSYDAAMYCGTNCFHRRESLSGRKYLKDYRWNSDIEAKKKAGKTSQELEEASKVLANCSYEKDTQWGTKMGLIYGFAVEDVVTGLTIQCRGWKSVFYNPKRAAFLVMAPTTLDISLIQFKRWSDGLFQIFLSKYCPFIYGHGKIKFGAQTGYCIFLLSATVSLLRSFM